MRGVLPVLVLTLAIAVSAVAQTTAGGGVKGFARDEQGGVVPGVVVSATSESATGVHRTMTGGNGEYHLTDLPPGEYKITAELTGFATVKRPSGIVRAGKNCEGAVWIKDS